MTLASILTTAQWQQIDQLASSLDREQAIWVCGYLAGRSQLTPPTVGDPVAGVAGAVNGNGNGAAAAVIEPPVAAPAARLASIVYATDTGNSKELAGMLSAAAEAKGIPTKVTDLADYKTRGLKDEQDVLIIAATHGEGEPPPAALDFFEFVQGKRAPKLDGVRFAVLALGDSTYEHYCAPAASWMSASRSSGPSGCWIASSATWITRTTPTPGSPRSSSSSRPSPSPLAVARRSPLR